MATATHHMTTLRTGGSPAAQILSMLAGGAQGGKPGVAGSQGTPDAFAALLAALAAAQPGMAGALKATPAGQKPPVADPAAMAGLPLPSADALAGTSPVDPDAPAAADSAAPAVADVKTGHRKGHRHDPLLEMIAALMGQAQPAENAAVTAKTPDAPAIPAAGVPGPATGAATPASATVIEAAATAPAVPTPLDPAKGMKTAPAKAGTAAGKAHAVQEKDEAKAAPATPEILSPSVPAPVVSITDRAAAITDRAPASGNPEKAVPDAAALGRAILSAKPAETPLAAYIARLTPEEKTEVGAALRQMAAQMAPAAPRAIAGQSPQAPQPVPSAIPAATAPVPPADTPSTPAGPRTLADAGSPYEQPDTPPAHENAAAAQKSPETVPAAPNPAAPKPVDPATVIAQHLGDPLKRDVALKVETAQGTASLAPRHAPQLLSPATLAGAHAAPDAKTPPAGPATAAASPAATPAAGGPHIGKGEDETASSSFSAHVDDALSVAAGGSGPAPADGSSASASARAPQAPQPPQPPAAQVAVSITRALGDGSNRFVVKLHPDDMGEVEVDLRIKHDGSVHAALKADRPDVLHVLERDSKSLQQAFENAGLKADAGSMSFSLKQDGGQDQQFADGRPQWQPQHGASGGGEDRARPTPSLPAAAHRSHSGDLDVWI